MKTTVIVAGPLALALMLASLPALAQHPEEHHAAPAPMHRPEPPHPPEAHPGPRGYERAPEPKGWNSRPPANFERGQYQHNFRAARSFHIGPYHRPSGWVSRRWAFGMTLPRAYFAAPYLIADYWLFALEVPPGGYEWVRDDTDALLVNIDTGEILQVEYDVFA